MNRRDSPAQTQRDRRFFPPLLALALTLLTLLTACTLPTVTAQERMFVNLKLEFLDEYKLPNRMFEETRVGGLSGITYDRQRDRFYALSDDPSYYAPARFYTLKLTLDSDSPHGIGIQKFQVEGVTFLTGEDGKNYPLDQINPEGIAFAAPKTVFIASEGVTAAGIPPFVNQFDLETGSWQFSLPIPERYLPDATDAAQKRGVQNNLGFESLTVNPRGSGDARVDPFRLFTATEAPLVQDREIAKPNEQGETPKLPQRNRLLHYLISDGPPLLISEHLYPLDTSPRWSILNGLTDLLALEQGGQMLSLERNFGFFGYGARIFQLATGTATDTSAIASLKGQLKGVAPVRKKLLLDLGELDIPLDNLEGMTLGPRLPDGTQSLILVSDDQFNDDQATQFLLFRLKKGD